VYPRQDRALENIVISAAAEENKVRRWVFLLRLSSRAGVLSALTAVFADRGVSIETLNAHDASAGGPLGSAVLTFAATAAKKDYLARLLGRLSVVTEVTEFRYEDAAHARKSVTARVGMGGADLRALLPPSVMCDVISESADETTVLLLGPPPLLDHVLLSLERRGLLQSSDASVVVV